MEIYFPSNSMKNLVATEFASVKAVLSFVTISGISVQIKRYEFHKSTLNELLRYC